MSNNEDNNEQNIDETEESKAEHLARELGVPIQFVTEAMRVVGTDRDQIKNYLQTNRGYENGG